VDTPDRHNEARRDVKGKFLVVGGVVLVQVGLVIGGSVGASMSGSRVLGGGGFGHDWEETSSGFDESRS
jgi:hypothetical protein